jgi:membrane protein YdbS with pleckstrin-like domain
MIKAVMVLTMQAVTKLFVVKHSHRYRQCRRRSLELLEDVSEAQRVKAMIETA